MQNRLLLAVILIAVALSVSVYIILNREPAGQHVKSIARYTDTPGEETALLVAESLNYTDIFQVGRFDEPSNSNLSDYSHDARAQYIDGVVIEYYDDRFESLKGKLWSTMLDYSAEVNVWDEIRVIYVPPQNQSPYVNEVRFIDSHGTVVDVTSGSTRYAYGNGSGIHEIQYSTVDFDFLNCYIVRMKLHYGESFAPDGGYSPYVRQTVILDENFKPLLVCVESSYAVA